jgi:hypothetical protein
MSTQHARPAESRGRGKARLGRRLDGIGWALFLIMIGGLWLMPEGTVPEGTWLIGVGLIMLGISAIRSVGGIKVSWFTVVLGVIALATGASGFFGVNLPWFPILLILIGASIILEQVLDPD